MTSENEMKMILDWLITTDPSSNHNNACQLHEEHTGQWLTNSPEYENWKSGQSRFLWLHGIPGAGKTVLLSYIAEDVKTFTRESEDLVSVYYYCYFGHNRDETTHFLRWVIGQLCRKIGGVPPEVRNMFREGVQPTATELLHVLCAVADNFSRVYITIDALDESANRAEILQMLCKIFESEKLTRIQLLATSRKELDIERALLPAAHELSLSNPYVDEDIRTYVKARLREDLKFSRWPDSLRNETESVLVKGAKGMFRWAFCQLDILKRLNTTQDIRLALTQLPKTLDETYERILCNIPSENKKMAHRILNLLVADYTLTLDQVSDLLAIDLEQPSFDRKNRPLDPYAPIEACTCLLIHHADTDILNLAHYTVMEYLFSTRIGHGPAQFFHITDDSMYYIAASCFIIYMLYENYDNENKPLIEVAIEQWNFAYFEIGSKQLQNSLSPLILQLYDPNQPHFQRWSMKMAKSMVEDFPVWSTESGAECCVTLAYLCWYGHTEAAKLFFDMRTDPFPFDKPLNWINHWGFEELVTEVQETDCGEDINKPLLEYLRGNETGQEIVTLLQIPALSRSSYLNEMEDLLELMTSRGADINMCSPTGFCLLTTALDSRTPIDITHALCHLEWGDNQLYIDCLLAYKTKVDLDRCSITPIQSAVQQAMRKLRLLNKNPLNICRVVRILLDNGAAVNAVANDSCQQQRICHTCRLFFQQLTVPALLEKEQESTELALQDRGNSSCYDTPLRILENYKKVAREKNRLHLDCLAKCEMLADLLKSYGAKSLHLFPVKGLPGYVEEDMEEWAKLNALQTATASSSSTSGYPLKQDSVQIGS